MIRIHDILVDNINNARRHATLIPLVDENFKKITNFPRTLADIEKLGSMCSSWYSLYAHIRPLLTVQHGGSMRSARERSWRWL